MRRFKRFSSAAKAGSSLKACACMSIGARAEKPVRSTTRRGPGLNSLHEPMLSAQASPTKVASEAAASEVKVHVMFRDFNLYLSQPYSKPTHHPPSYSNSSSNTFHEAASPLIHPRNPD